METQQQTNTPAPASASSGTRPLRRPFRAPRIVQERELKALASGVGPFSVSATGP